MTETYRTGLCQFWTLSVTGMTKVAGLRRLDDPLDLVRAFRSLAGVG